MKRASTITEAGYGGFLRPDRDLWAGDLTRVDFEQLYQPGRRGDGTLSQSSVPSTSDQVAKVLLTGHRPKGRDHLRSSTDYAASSWTSTLA